MNACCICKCTENCTKCAAAYCPFEASVCLKCQRDGIGSIVATRFAHLPSFSCDMCDMCTVTNITYCLHVRKEWKVLEVFARLLDQALQMRATTETAPLLRSLCPEIIALIQLRPARGKLQYKFLRGTLEALLQKGTKPPAAPVSNPTSKVGILHVLITRPGNSTPFCVGDEVVLPLPKGRLVFKVAKHGPAALFSACCPNVNAEMIVVARPLKINGVVEPDNSELLAIRNLDAALVAPHAARANISPTSSQTSTTQHVSITDWSMDDKLPVYKAVQEFIGTCRRGEKRKSTRTTTNSRAEANKSVTVRMRGECFTCHQGQSSSTSAVASSPRATVRALDKPSASTAAPPEASVDEDVVFDREVTLEQRNRTGFASAIDLTKDC